VNSGRARSAETAGNGGHPVSLLMQGSAKGMPMLRPVLFAVIIAAAGCAPHAPPQLLSPDPTAPPRGAPSAVPLPLPPYPYEPGFWV